MTYIVPHFRYGSLIFYPEVNNQQIQSKHTYAYTKMYNQTVKTLWKLPKNTNETIIKAALGQWNAEVIYSGNYATNANKWM